MFTVSELIKELKNKNGELTSSNESLKSKLELLDAQNKADFENLNKQHVQKINDIKSE